MIGLIVFIAVMGFSLGKREKLSWPENFIGDSVTFVQQWFYKPAGYIAGLFEDVRTMRDIYQENEQLRILASRYARDRITYNFLQQENERLMDALDFTERQKNMYKYKYVIAQVVAADLDPNNLAFKINLGSTDGIKPDMAVVSTDGLVGLVSRVFPLYSTVTPITQLNPDSPNPRAISATVVDKEGKSFGIVEDYDKGTGMLLMNRIAENDPLAEGDVVITSGLGNVFPRGLEIGTVESRQVGDFGLTYTAAIKPSAKLDRLTEVFVVIPPDTGTPAITGQDERTDANAADQLEEAEGFEESGR